MFKLIDRYKWLNYILILFLYACNSELPETNQNVLPYTVNGQIINSFGLGIKGVKVYYSGSDFVLSNSEGHWSITNFYGQNTLTPIIDNYSFYPTTINVSNETNDILFTGSRIPNETETQLFNWFNNQQLENGLLESVENGNIVSLYDNALSALVFMLKGDNTKAEKIFDFFNARIDSELTNGVGGFSQFRDRNGIPSNRRWMGDNAWLLIALNNYKAKTGNTTYDALATEISNWLISLQDTDGGLFAGYAEDDSLLNYKVTEGNIDAFNAINGYTSFHVDLLNYLDANRWDSLDKNLVAWVENPQYLYALDLHAWSYSIFPDYPYSSLTTANRFLNTQIATSTNNIITGYCFDEDNDAVWLEGTGQMALAYILAFQTDEADNYLNEMENAIISSTNYPNSIGFPYASNIGTSYGISLLWTGADTNIAISGGAWYLFAKYGFNPFEVGKNKNILTTDMFWLN